MVFASCARTSRVFLKSLFFCKNFGVLVSSRAADDFMDKELPYIEARHKLLDYYRAKRKTKKMKEILLNASVPVQGVGLEFVDGGKGKKQRVVMFSRAKFEEAIDNQSKTLHRSKKSKAKVKKT